MYVFHKYMASTEISSEDLCLLCGTWHAVRLISSGGSDVECALPARSGGGYGAATVEPSDISQQFGSNLFLLHIQLICCGVWNWPLSPIKISYFNFNPFSLEEQN